MAAGLLLVEGLVRLEKQRYRAVERLFAEEADRRGGGGFPARRARRPAGTRRARPRQVL